MHVVDEPERRTWWEAATTTGVALRRYELRSKTDDVLGSATFWDMQPLSKAWGVVAAGLLHVDIEGPRRRQGLAQYLIAEAMHDLSQEGVALIEAHTTDANVPASNLFEKLDFSQSGQGILFEKPAIIDQIINQPDQPFVRDFRGGVERLVLLPKEAPIFADGQKVEQRRDLVVSRAGSSQDRRLCYCTKEPMYPAPGLSIMVLGHGRCILKVFQPFDTRRHVPSSSRPARWSVCPWWKPFAGCGTSKNSASPSSSQRGIPGSTACRYPCVVSCRRSSAIRSCHGANTANVVSVSIKHALRP